MGSFGKVKIGHQAPDFHCEAVVKGKIEEVCLSSYVGPGRNKWLILLFIPAAFSFVCPTEVLAFQNCIDEFNDRHCNVVFVSVDTKHSLWHWQNVPRQYGGLGSIDISLLSDVSRDMSRNYGVLNDAEGVCLRGMFIIDDQSIVQQVTVNNNTVGRSVLEALRLLEAFQAVAKHGVLCPVDWRPSDNASATINTINNLLTESYDDRLAQLQAEFGDTPLTDLDVKYKEQEGRNEKKERQRRTSKDKRRYGSLSQVEGMKPKHSVTSPSSSRSMSYPNSAAPLGDLAKELVKAGNLANASTKGPQGRISLTSTLSANSIHPEQSSSAPISANVTPTPTPGSCYPVPVKKHSIGGGSARHSRGHSTCQASPNPPSLYLHRPNTFESLTGSQVILEFAEPTTYTTAQPSPHTVHGAHYPMNRPPSSYPTAVTTRRRSSISSKSSPVVSRTSSTMSSSSAASKGPTPPGGGFTNGNVEGSQTRLQATFDVIKKMGQGFTSPKLGRKNTAGASVDSTKENGKGEDATKAPGYFDVVVEEGVEA